MRLLQILLIALVHTRAEYSWTEYEDGAHGSLEGDVLNWAVLIQNYILQLASDGIKKDFSQAYLDSANYTFERKDGRDIVEQVKQELGDYFSKKKKAAEILAQKVKEIYEDFIKHKKFKTGKLTDLKAKQYRDSDIPEQLAGSLKFAPYYKQNVSQEFSTIKIADEVPREEEMTVDTVNFTAKLEDTFKENAGNDEFLRWQYFGSTAGIVRIYPGREWSTNFAGFYNDYDPRVRPWYIAATSGPKDVVIVLDCSLSMKGEKFSIAKGVAKTVINTLTKQDYVNVVCARASHWDQVGKLHYYGTTALSCQQDTMVPATIAHRKDLKEKIQKLKAGGTSELEKGLEIAYDLLKSNPRTGCQSVIVFVTDGQDTDGENIRCGPGYYTRSGYVPGPICKYNWTKVWSVADGKSKYSLPQTRIFSYLIKEDAEEFPGRLACSHRGSLVKLNNGQNLIFQMRNYFDFLSSSALNTKAMWTSPYLDAWGLGIMVTYTIPVISNGTTIGVVGVDATLDQIENFLTKHQWGNVYSFLINKEGETIYHPKLKPSTNLLEDPIFIPITQLETDEEFPLILKDMREGNTDMKVIEQKDKSTKTFFYAAIDDSEYSFAYILTDTDKEFRRSQEPVDRSSYTTSYYNLLKEYLNPVVKEEFPHAWEELEILENETQRYPGLTISYKHSTIFLAPKSHCDPIQYLYDDNLAKKTINAHRYMNSYETDDGCVGDQVYDKGIRADVLITQPIEEIWKSREFESLSQVKWTNIGLRSGVFRTYPGHRSKRGYDPTKRPWYRRTSSTPWRTSISTPYMDAAGVGKIVTISQAVFEGMTPRTDEDCFNITQPLPGGCVCEVDTDCISRVCYVSEAPGPNSDQRRCATERVEGVTGLDILYDDFQNRTMEAMQASNGLKSCNQHYTCPNGEDKCQTRCYLFDSKAFLVMDPDFLIASALDESKYEQVQLGTKEGEVMKDLIYKHDFFDRVESIDFQGSCRITPEEPKLSLDGIPKNPGEQDDYIRNKGPIPQFNSEYGCIQDVIQFKTNDKALGPSGMITGNVSGPCMSGFYYVTSLPKTNLYLLIIENWNSYPASLFYNFNCQITRSIVNSGAYRIINGTCNQASKSSRTLAEEGKCPKLSDKDLMCIYTTATPLTSTPVLILLTLFCTYLIYL